MNFKTIIALALLNTTVFCAIAMEIDICQKLAPEVALMRANQLDDECDAFEIYSALAAMHSTEGWHAEALLKKGEALYNGLGVDVDEEKALECYLKCFDLHYSPQALVCIGDFYENDRTIDSNFELAADYYKDAFSMNYFFAGYKYANLLTTKKIKPSTDNPIEEALSYIRPVVLADATTLRYGASSEALYFYAMTLLDNDQIEEFKERGLSAFLLAAERDHAQSLEQLSILYRTGLHVEKDIEQADEYLEQAIS